jgi:uncharacterized protein (DUF2147 family)
VGRGEKEMMRKRIIFIVLILFGIAAICARPVTILAQNVKPQDQKNEKNLYQRLEGRWVRPDGGYILELKNVGSTGDVKAMYFNPRPINVGISNWRKEEGKLTIFVELRDINYQGSTYTLQYDADSDRLNGKYFQAPTGQTYDIEFVRVK